MKAIFLLGLAVFAVGVTSFAHDDDRAAREYREAEAKSMKRAVEIFPELGVAGSTLNAAMQKATLGRRLGDPQYFSDPNWPVRIACRRSTSRRNGLHQRRLQLPLLHHARSVHHADSTLHENGEDLGK